MLTGVVGTGTVTGVETGVVDGTGVETGTETGTGVLTGVLVGVVMGVLVGVGTGGGGQPPVGHSQFTPSQPGLQVHCERETHGPELAGTQLEAHGTSWKVKYAMGEVKLSVIKKSGFIGWNVGCVEIPSMKG